MSAFKDAVAKDVTAVFLNLDEFADRHNLNGRDVICLVDKDLTDPYKQTASSPLEGIFVETLNIYVRPEDMERRPVENELLYLDDKMYFVVNVSDENGLYVITAEVKNS
ncbi:MAG: hypothetical protein IKA32_11955 [Lentisphaeria bacterium]|nr:hypothetical protein [Lentisphaeria bacterium]